MTTYPVLRWDIAGNTFAATPNLRTLLRARDTLIDAGFQITLVNAGGNACVATMGDLAALGVTHVEPGQAFVGATPGHFFSDMPERPAVVWVSEVAYADGDHAYAFASGMVCNASVGNVWNAIRYDRIMALVGQDPATLGEQAFWAYTQSYAYSDPSAFMVEDGGVATYDADTWTGRHRAGTAALNSHECSLRKALGAGKTLHTVPTPGRSPVTPVRHAWQLAPFRNDVLLTVHAPERRLAGRRPNEEWFYLSGVGAEPLAQGRCRL